VKDEFAGNSNDSIEKAIYFNSKAEILEGDNAYACSGCNKKVTASKGTHLDKLPKILTL
jgi:ubiquitin C-terminal hydrolase